MQQTAARLGKIRSGTLDLRLIVSPRGRGRHGDIGFTLHGPFAFRKGGLPVLDVTYTQLASGKRASARLVSNGVTAYAMSGGRRIALSSSQLDELRTATSQVQSAGGLSQLPIGDWVDHPKVSDGGDVGGASTDHVSAGLDVVHATNALLRVASNVGGTAPQIKGGEAKRLEDSVRSSSFDLWTGKRDHLLRRLRIRADFGLGVPRDLAQALGKIVGANVTFELGVANPNKPIRTVKLVPG
jgi:hypothetical protein